MTPNGDRGYGSRKFILTCATFLLTGAWVFMHIMTADQWMMFNALTLGGYGVINYYRGKGAPCPPPDSTPAKT